MPYDITKPQWVANDVPVTIPNELQTKAINGNGHETQKSMG